MNSRLWTGIILCVVPCLLVFVDFHTYVIRDAVRGFIQKKNILAVNNNSFHEYTKSDEKQNNNSFHEYTKFPSKSRNKERLHILLLTYFRSGSTFTGSMFDANSDAFYSFEPFHRLQENIHGKKTTLSYLNGTKIDVETRLAKRETFESILHCRLSELSITVMKEEFWNLPKSSNTYWRCRKTSHTEFGNCVKAFEKVCLQKNFTVIKTIRFSMEEVHDMLQKDNSLKVIHLIRDPRPSLYSAKTWGYIKDSLEEKALNHCTRVYNDMLVTKQLLKAYPEKVKLVFYEDITIDTKAVVKDIYKFVGLPFKSEIEEHIHQLSVKDNKCFLCLGRSNATYQLNKWRMTMPFKDVKVIDSKCGMLYDVVGYKPATSEILLRDLNNPLRVK